MTKEQRKYQIEIAIFKGFIEKAGLPIYPQSIVKRDLCLYKDEGYVAFELMEFCDSDLTNAMSKEEKAHSYGHQTRPRRFSEKSSRGNTGQITLLNLYYTPMIGWLRPIT